MTYMKDREEGFEGRFALDEELHFKAIARRNRFLGLWAAEKLGKTGTEAEVYARKIILADMEEAGDEDVLQTLRQDFSSENIDFPEEEIHSIMNEFMEKAKQELWDSEI